MDGRNHPGRYSGPGILNPVTRTAFPMGKGNLHSFADFKLRLSTHDDVSQ